MKVALDISPLSSGHKVRGVGFYLKHLKAALEKKNDHIDFQFFTALSEVKDVDLIHFPYFDPFSQATPFNLSVPTITTIHDLTPIKFSKHFPAGIKGNLRWRMNKYQAKKLSAIITDSHSSKKDIIKYLSYPEDKIHVVYLAAGEEFSPKDVTSVRARELTEKYNLPEKFALYVGDVTWNKNLPRLMRACISQDIPLVMAGKALASNDYDKDHPWNKDLLTSQQLITSANNIVKLGFVEDLDLVDLYRMATVFVMPSLYEGFGLPIIEAMQSGTPVVTSREGSLPEVGGEAVYYVDATDEQSITDGISNVLNSTELQDELSQKGINQAKKFSWQKTAQQTIDIYKLFSSDER
jgi:glycosyltransferase involved in cell wall biosynthesis